MKSPIAPKTTPKRPSHHAGTLLKATRSATDRLSLSRCTCRSRRRKDWVRGRAGRRVGVLRGEAGAGRRPRTFFCRFTPALLITEDAMESRAPATSFPPIFNECQQECSRSRSLLLYSKFTCTLSYSILFYLLVPVVIKLEFYSCVYDLTKSRERPRCCSRRHVFTHLRQPSRLQ